MRQRPASEDPKQKLTLSPLPPSCVLLFHWQNPEKQFDEEHIKMAKLMGITPEELAKTMSNTAK
jgi:hypothetical protein